jgi:hypothetical protein
MRTTARSIGALAVIAIVVGIANWFSVMSPLSAAKRSDPRNEGLEVFAYHRYLVLPGEIVFDLRGLSGDKAPLDVDRMLIQFAHELRDREFDRVYLAWKGDVRFVLKGDYFRRLGQEYGLENALYTLRTLPENLYTPDGQKAFDTWTGGLLGVLTRQMEDLHEFHVRWFLRALAAY